MNIGETVEHYGLELGGDIAEHIAAGLLVERVVGGGLLLAVVVVVVTYTVRQRLDRPAYMKQGRHKRH